MTIEGVATEYSAPGEVFNLTTTVNPADAGTIEAVPNSNKIKEGKEVTLTAKKTSDISLVSGYSTEQSTQQTRK